MTDGETLILGIESSCDDTAAAVLRARPGQPVGDVLSNVVLGQDSLHAAFGGVVPEIAARAHAERLDLAVERALAEAGLGPSRAGPSRVGLSRLDAVAVAAGPGLIGGVMAGVMFAKGLAAARDLPLWGVNHLAGHALSPRLTEDIGFPYLLLLVSGGHCQLLAVEGPARFRRLGGTIDDAAGEAFDKVAKLLGLPQPGGPAIERAALSGDPARFAFPRPLLDREGADLSFSGLKTAVRRARDRLVAAQGGLWRRDVADIAASFQARTPAARSARGRGSARGRRACPRRC
jgi:N6-L-threonylcarbamoyladenine synthase